MVIWHSDCCHEKDQTIDSLNESDFGRDILRKMNLIYFAVDSKPVYSLETFVWCSKYLEPGNIPILGVGMFYDIYRYVPDNLILCAIPHIYTWCQLILTGVKFLSSSVKFSQPVCDNNIFNYHAQSVFAHIWKCSIQTMVAFTIDAIICLGV